MGGTLDTISSHRQGHLPPKQVVPSPVQPGLGLRRKSELKTTQLDGPEVRLWCCCGVGLREELPVSPTRFGVVIPRLAQPCFIPSQQEGLTGSQHCSCNPFPSLITSGCCGSPKDFKGMVLGLHRAVSPGSPILASQPMVVHEALERDPPNNCRKH